MEVLEGVLEVHRLQVRRLLASRAPVVLRRPVRLVGLRLQASRPVGRRLQAG